MLLGVDPLDWFPSIDFASPWSILGVVAMMIFTGLLKTKPDFTRLERDRDHWRDGFEKLLTAHTETVHQIDELIEQGRTTNTLLTNALLSGLPHAREGKKT